MSGLSAAVMKKRAKPDANAAKQEDNDTVFPEMQMAEMLGHRIRYFSAGAVVNEAFASAKERFGARRKDGARVMKGNAEAARGQLWSMRDLKESFKL